MLQQGGRSAPGRPAGTPPAAAVPAIRAGRRARQRRAAGIVGPDAEAQQLGGDAPRQVAVAGDQRRRRLPARRSHRAARWRSPPPRRARSPLRPASRRQRRLRMSARRKPRAAGAQSSVVSAGRRASDRIDPRRRSASSERADLDDLGCGAMPILPSSWARPYCGWPSTERVGASWSSTDHDRSSSAMSRPGSTTAPLGSRAIAESSSAVAGMEPVEPAAITGPRGRRPRKSRRLAADQRAAMRGRIGPVALAERLRPARADDLQEIQRHLPPAGETARHQLGKPVPVGAFRLDLVHQRGEVARQPDRVGRRSRHDHLLLEQRRDMRGQAALPGAHQRRRDAAGGRARRSAAQARCSCALRLERRFVLVELAERPDGRQDGGASARAARQIRRAARARRAASAR